MDTTTLDGAACALCGDDATPGRVRLWLDGAWQEVSLCDACHCDDVFLCDGCGQRHVADSAHRSFGSSSLYCDDCHYAQMPVTMALEMDARHAGRSHR